MLFCCFPIVSNLIHLTAFSHSTITIHTKTHNKFYLSATPNRVTNWNKKNQHNTMTRCNLNRRVATCFSILNFFFILEMTLSLDFFFRIFFIFVAISNLTHSTIFPLYKCVYIYIHKINNLHSKKNLFLCCLPLLLRRMNITHSQQ